MRSDFYGLPWAAQQAIRKGERAQRLTGKALGQEVVLTARIEALEAEVAHWQLQCGEARNTLDRIFGITRAALSTREGLSTGGEEG